VMCSDLHRSGRLATLRAAAGDDRHLGGTSCGIAAAALALTLAPVASLPA
jgi:hypothetical protein